MPIIDMTLSYDVAMAITGKPSYDALAITLAARQPINELSQQQSGRSALRSPGSVGPIAWFASLPRHIDLISAMSVVRSTTRRVDRSAACAARRLRSA